MLHVKACPYLPGTANRFSTSSSRLSLKQAGCEDSGCRIRADDVDTYADEDDEEDGEQEDEDRDLSDSRLLVHQESRLVGYPA